MMKDYSERRQSRTVPHPKRPAVWPYVLLILILLLVAFAAGLGTGWYLYRPGGKYYKAVQTLQPSISPAKSSSLPPQGEPIVPIPSQHPTQTVPQPSQNSSLPHPASEKDGVAPTLTFYNTLQKGNKGLMGTGINQPKEGQSATPKPAATPSAEH